MSADLKNHDGYKQFDLSDKLATVLFYCIFIIGLGLRFYFYFINRDLGADEAHLALNFIHLGYKDLAKPLENFQSAPILFLWSVETISRIFGFSELSLRVVPFIISIVTFPFFYFFVRDLTGNKAIALVAFLLFALNFSILYFSTELKPYTIDVSSFIIIGFLLFSNSAFVSKRRVNLLAISGCLLLLLSISSVIILICASIVMIKYWYKKQKDNNNNIIFNIKNVFVVFTSWGGVFLTNFFIFIYRHPYGPGMKSIWSWTFCPSDVFSKEFVFFINSRIEDTLFSNLLSFNKNHCFPYFLLFIAIVSAINMIMKKQYNIIFFSLFLISFHLVLSMLHVYPFFQRFILYLLPAFIIWFSVGLVIVMIFLARKAHWIFSALLCVFFISETNIISVNNYSLVGKQREFQPILNYIDKKYPKSTLLIATPFTLYYYYYETGRAKNKNFKAIDWYLKPHEFKYHKLVLPITQNYLLLYSIGEDFDGFGETLRDLKKKGQIKNQFDYSIFQLSEINPQTLKNQGELIKHIDCEYFKNIQPSIQGSKSYIPLWNNDPISFDLPLLKGNYQLILTAKGDPANGIYPHLNIKINGKRIFEFNLKKEMDTYVIDFSTNIEMNNSISISMDNDETNGNEDRNAFVGDLFIFKK